MDTTITMNLSEEEFKTLTVVCKALKTTPEAVLRASAKKLFNSPMDFMFEAFSNEGFHVSEGQPTVKKTKPALDEVKKKPVEPKQNSLVQVAKPEPEPVNTPPKVVEKLPSMGTPQFREYHEDILEYLSVHPKALVKNILFDVLDINGYDYVGTDKNFRHYLEVMRDNGEIIIDNTEGVRCSIVKEDEPVAKPLTADIILKASGKYRKEFYAVVAKASTKTLKDEDFTHIFEGEGYDENTIIPAIDKALEDLARKRLIIFSGKNGGKITILEKFREKIYKTYPELKAQFPTNA